MTSAELGSRILRAGMLYEGDAQLAVMGEEAKRLCAPQWRPISEVKPPKKRVPLYRVMLWDGLRVWEDSWVHSKQVWFEANMSGAVPTHFMPLPEPPK